MLKFQINRFQVLETIGVYNGVFLLGIMLAIPGPTLLDLSEQVGVSSGDLTTLFTVRASGFIVGCFFGGILFDRFNRRLVLAGALIGGAASLFAVPFSRNFLELLASMTVMGIFGGALDAAVNSRILDIWKEGSASFMQALHFLFGVGALVAPLIAEPFLSEKTNHLSNSTSLDTLNFNSSEAPTTHSLRGVTDLESSSRIVIPYSIGGGLTLANAIYVLLLMALVKDTFKKEGEDNFKFLFKSKPKFIIYMATTTLLSVLICGSELGFGQLVSTFSVEGSFSLSKSTGSFLTALYWGCYSGARFLAIFVAAKVRPFHMLVVDFLLLLAGSLVLVLSLQLANEQLLWAGTAIVGFSIASAFPCTLMWTEEFVSITGKVAAVFVTGTAMGEMLVPLGTGQLMEAGFIDALLYVFSINSLVNFLVIILLYIMARYWTKPDETSVRTNTNDLEQSNNAAQLSNNTVL